MKVIVAQDGRVAARGVFEAFYLIAGIAEVDQIAMISQTRKCFHEAFHQGSGMIGGRIVDYDDFDGMLPDLGQDRIETLPQ